MRQRGGESLVTTPPVKTVVKTLVKTVVKTLVRTVVKNGSENMVKKFNR